MLISEGAPFLKMKLQVPKSLFFQLLMPPSQPCHFIYTANTDFTFTIFSLCFSLNFPCMPLFISIILGLLLTVPDLIFKCTPLDSKLYGRLSVLLVSSVVFLSESSFLFLTLYPVNSHLCSNSSHPYSKLGLLTAAGENPNTRWAVPPHLQHSHLRWVLRTSWQSFQLFTGLFLSFSTAILLVHHYP